MLKVTKLVRRRADRRSQVSEHSASTCKEFSLDLLYLPFNGHRVVLKPIGRSLQIQDQGDGKRRDPHQPTKRLY